MPTCPPEFGWESLAAVIAAKFRQLLDRAEGLYPDLELDRDLDRLEQFKPEDDGPSKNGRDG